MRIRNVCKIITPNFIRRYFRQKINYLISKIKAPRMLWGYKDSTGVFQSRTRISDTVFMYHPERIKIADNVFVWHYTILDGTGGLDIGEGSQIGAWVGIFTHSSHIAIRIYGDHYQEIPEDKKKGFPMAEVKIGNYVFIGAGSKILPGVTIGNGVLISAGSVVNKSINDFEIVAGNPAKVIGDTRKIDNKYMQDPQLKVWYSEWQNSG